MKSVDISIVYILEDDTKKFVATVKLKQESSTAKITLTYLSTPLLILMTLPRIFYEAYLLAYLRKLVVYPKPAPVSQNTVKQLPADAFEQFAKRVVMRYLAGMNV